MNSIFLLLCTCAILQNSPEMKFLVASDITEAQRASWSLRSPDDASRLAGERVGIDAEQSKNATAELVQTTVDETPFVHTAIVGRPLWWISFKNWSVNPIAESPSEARVWYGPRNLHVLLDPTDGSLLKVNTDFATGGNSLPFLDGHEADVRLLPAERYHGIAKSPWPISFAEVIRIVQRGGGNPRAAKHISAVWVEWSHMGSAPKPMWIVTLKGIPPEPLDQIRYVVDPVERKWVFASTGP